MEWKKSTTAMVEVPFKAVKKAMVSGHQLPQSTSLTQYSGRRHSLTLDDFVSARYA